DRMAQALECTCRRGDARRDFRVDRRASECRDVQDTSAPRLLGRSKRRIREGRRCWIARVRISDRAHREHYVADGARNRPDRLEIERDRGKAVAARNASARWLEADHSDM